MRANEPKSMSEMQQDVRKWIKRRDIGRLPWRYWFYLVKDLSEITGYHTAAYKAGEMLHTWVHDKVW